MATVSIWRMRSRVTERFCRSRKACRCIRPTVQNAGDYLPLPIIKRLQNVVDAGLEQGVVQARQGIVASSVGHQFAQVILAFAAQRFVERQGMPIHFQRPIRNRQRNPRLFGYVFQAGRRVCFPGSCDFRRRSLFRQWFACALARGSCGCGRLSPG